MDSATIPMTPSDEAARIVTTVLIKASSTRR
jgi:hypothetical protein